MSEVHVRKDEFMPVPGIYYFVTYDSSDVRGWGQLVPDRIGVFPEEIVSHLGIDEDCLIAKIHSFHPYRDSEVRNLGGGTALLDKMAEDASALNCGMLIGYTKLPEMQEFLEKKGFNSFNDIYYKIIS